MDRAREVFDGSEDVTIGIEEEFQILDPETLDLVQRFEELRDAAEADPPLAESITGELIASEIEIRSGKGATFADAVAQQQDVRERLFRLVGERGARLAATGTHPWSPWQEQRIIDTPHYRRREEWLKYVAWRNNTFSLHVHVGVRGADRAIAVCDHLRALLPGLLAVSANSPFLDGRDSGLHSARTQIFTRSFPRCGVHEPFGDWDSYAEFANFLVDMNSIEEHTQLWWSVRPHHDFGTVEFRICDAQTRAEDSTALAGLIAACVAQAALDYDEGVMPEPVRGRYIEENMWRAIRHGMEGRMIDFDRREEFDARAIPERLLTWTAPAREHMGIDPALPDETGAQRQRRVGDMREAFAAEVDLTHETYAGEGVAT
ncbi:MAG: carboxylate-amine ligase [Thermoleophilaceae bacterium]